MTQDTCLDNCIDFAKKEKNKQGTKLSSKSRRHKHSKRNGLDECAGPYDSVRGETALWVAVITQAMMDALSRSKNAEATYHKHEAIRWLSDNSKDFKMVCHMAGRDPDAIRCKAKRALVSPGAWRAAPGKGKRYLERKAYRQRQKQKGSESTDIKNESVTPENETKIIIGPWR